MGVHGQQSRSARTPGTVTRFRTGPVGDVLHVDEALQVEAAFEVEEAFEHRLLEAIDERLRVCSARSSFSRAEHVDALLELRMLASDLIALRSLDASTTVARTSSQPHRRRWPGRVSDAPRSRR
jgi:hypothetical protein